jgi:hypothetical protein
MPVRRSSSQRRKCRCQQDAKQALYRIPHHCEILEVPRMAQRYSGCKDRMPQSQHQGMDPTPRGPGPGVSPRLCSAADSAQNPVVKGHDWSDSAAARSWKAEHSPSPQFGRLKDYASDMLPLMWRKPARDGLHARSRACQPKDLHRSRGEGYKMRRPMGLDRRSIVVERTSLPTDPLPTTLNHSPYRRPPSAPWPPRKPP